MSKIAERAKIPASATVGMTNKVKELKSRGIDVISLGAGEPGFVTPSHIREFAKKALDEGKTHYAPGAGLIELREAVAEKLSLENGVDADPKSEILITVGGKEAVFLSIQALIDPGQKVVLTDPGWVTYEPCVRMAGGLPVFVPLDENIGFRLRVEEVEKIVDKKTKMLVINSPNNPTGGVLTRNDLEGIADIAKKYDLYVLSDELYEYLVYDGVEHVSIGSLPGMRERTITVNGFSKAYAMTGWRLGYMAAPREIMRYILTIHEHSVTSPCTFAQAAAAEALRDQRSREFIQMMVSEYKKRRDIVVHELDRIDQVRCTKPQGAFYAFPNTLHTGKSSVDLTNYLLDNARVATIPGSAFGKQGENHLRITFTNPEEELKEAMKRIREALEKINTS